MTTVTGWHRELVRLVNELRAERGAPPLAIDETLHDAAAWRAQDMRTRNYFSYTTPPVGPREPARPEGPPSAVIQRFGYVPASDGWTAAESILIGEVDDNGAVSAAEVLAALRDSPHDLQILAGEHFYAIGVGGPAGNGNDHPMAGVCVLELGSEVVAPVDELGQSRFFLPREAPPVETPREARDLTERVAIAGTVGAPLPGSVAGAVAEAAAAEPTGPVKTPAPWGSFNCDWADINRWNDILHVAANEFGAPFERLKAHVVIESQGNPKAVQKNDVNGRSYGLMQIVPFGVGWEGWHADVIRLAGHDGDPAKMLVNDPGLNVRVGAFILASLKADHGSWDKASSAFFLGNPEWKGKDTGGSGATGKKYRKALKGLLREMGAETDTDNGNGPVTPDGPVTPGAGTGAALAAEARRHVGERYVHAHAGPKEFDCSGLVFFCYQKVTGKELSQNFRDSHQQFRWGDPVDPTQARPGDLVFFDTADGGEWRLGNNASHVGIYGGGNDLINALNEDQGVVVSNLSGNYWTSKWIGTRRVLPPG